MEKPRQRSLTVESTGVPRHLLAYCECGDANAPNVLICAHGLSRSGRDFDLLAQTLAHEYRVVCPDYPGRGASERLADARLYHNGTYIADTLALIDALAFERLDFVGTSMGGLIGMAIAAMPDAPIRRLVVNDVGPFLPGSALEQIGAYLTTRPTFRTRAEALAYFRKAYAGFGPLTQAHYDHMVTHLTVPAAGGNGLVPHYDPAIIDNFVQALAGDIALWEIWEAIDAPVLVLRGEDSPLLTRQTALKMLERAAPTRLIEFQGCAHAPSLMVEEQIRAVSDWLTGEAP